VCQPRNQVGFVGYIALFPVLAVMLLGLAAGPAFRALLMVGALMAGFGGTIYLAMRSQPSRTLRAEVRGLTIGSGTRLRHLPWSAIEKIELQAIAGKGGYRDTLVTVVTTAGPLRFYRRGDEGAVALEHGLNRLLEARQTGRVPHVYQAPVGATPTDAAGQLSAAEIARCLGIEASGRLVCRSTYFFRGQLVAALGLGVLTVIGAVGAHWASSEPARPEQRVGVVAFHLLPWLTWIGALWLACGLPRQWRLRGLQADVDGLSAGHGAEARRVPWAGVLSAERIYAGGECSAEDRGVLVNTTAGPFHFVITDPGAKALEDGILNVLAARAAGYNLPSRAPISDAALSVAGEEHAPEAGRGLSRAEP